MFKLSCKIEILGSSKWVFEKVTEVRIVRSTETLTDTAEVTLPRKVEWQGYDDIPLKRGDMITISLGYDDNLSVAFRGYITTIGAKTPIVIRCEDEMWMLKQMPAVKKAYRKVDIETLLSDQNIGMPIQVLGEQNIGAYRQDKDTVAALLNNLREQGVRSFIKYENNNPILVCGVIFEKHASRLAVFDNHKNIISDDDLKVQSAADVRIKLKAVSLDGNNQKTEVQVGDADGELRTLHRYAVSAAELKRWAEAHLVRLKRDGLVGSFETFGHCLVDKLDTIGMIMEGKKMGEYHAEKNEIVYNTSGFRQNITLGDRKR